MPTTRRSSNVVPQRTPVAPTALMTPPAAPESNEYHATINNVLADVDWLYKICTQRRLLDGAKWASEMSYGINEYLAAKARGDLSNRTVTPSPPPDVVDMSVPRIVCDVQRGDIGAETPVKAHTIGLDVLDNPRIRLALSLFDTREFVRAAFILKPLAASPSQTDEELVAADPYATFMHYYALYLAAAAREHDMTPMRQLRQDPSSQRPVDVQSHMNDVRRQLRALHSRRVFDSFLAFLYALVLHHSRVEPSTVRALLASVVSDMPAFFPAWTLLTQTVTNNPSVPPLREQFLNCRHWCAILFCIECDLRCQKALRARQILLELHRGIFRYCDYVEALLARSYRETKDTMRSVQHYSRIASRDPYRIDSMDDYACELFTQSHGRLDDPQGRAAKVQLCRLARTCMRAQPFCRETQIVLGNYYGCRSDHEMAIRSFERALRYDGGRADGVWTLMGHEYMEIKNTSAAVQCYNRALDLDPYDYRAWNGLGMLYDMLRLYNHAIYHYTQAHLCRPDDSRMLVALGDMYQRRDSTPDRAIKCYWRAYGVGDMENTALLKLAKIFEGQGESGQQAAALCYLKYLRVVDKKAQRRVRDSSDASGEVETNEDEVDDVRAQCYHFLAEHALRESNLPVAAQYAQMSLVNGNRHGSRALFESIDRAMAKQKHEQQVTIDTTSSVAWRPQQRPDVSQAPLHAIEEMQE